MSKTVLEVGNCSFDHNAISKLIESHFAANVLRAHNSKDCLEYLESSPIDLILVNRLMDRDGSSGLDLIRTIKEHAELASIPVMMITNFMEHQQAAIRVGAELGFGKSELHSPATLEKLQQFLVVCDD